MSEKTGMQNGSQMRFNPQELSIIKNTFKGSEELLRVMRKIFLPEVLPYAPLGQTIDLWMTIPVDQLTPEEIVINLKARNMLITHLDQHHLRNKMVSRHWMPLSCRRPTSLKRKILKKLLLMQSSATFQSKMR
jgi:hypothetical protein